ncbi:hypothetical protein QR97_31915 [Streptomyces sp. PBH53]|nr:hypothetical protein QR97_31915 [Streptomyces sp. PBH53]
MTEVAGPREGLLPLIRQAVAVVCAGSLAGGADLQPIKQPVDTADALSRAADQIPRVRNDSAHAHNPASRRSESAEPGAASHPCHLP